MNKVPDMRTMWTIAWCGWAAVVVAPIAHVTAQVIPTTDNTAHPSQVENELRWEMVENESITLMNGDGETVWRFVYGAQRTHAYFHPLSPGHGISLTTDAPGDHVHHHGLWFCWKYINKVNFWEHAPGTDRPAGQTQWDVVEIIPRDDYSARIELAVRYVMPSGEVVLREQRVIETSTPDAHGFTIDWSGSFIAEAEEVLLDRTPLPGEPGGRVYGGYAGLSARLVQMVNRQASTLHGTVEFNSADRFRGKSNAFDYSGTLDGTDLGIAILSDPNNLNAPSPWYAIRTNVMSFFTPAVICYEPLTLKRAEAFRLRYRIIVHRGQWSSEPLIEAYQTYTETLTTDEPVDSAHKERDR